MNLAGSFNQFVFSHHLFTAKDRLLVAVSGGVDSVVLCELLRQGGFEFGIAHCNFQLRDADSFRDEDFVKKIAAQYNVPFHLARFHTAESARERKQSIQEAARELRYAWFEETRAENNYRYILTAHHADDNIETVLMHFFRGTGILGLVGIANKQGNLVRPLIFSRREELESFLQEHQLQYVTDTSNAKDDYTRNYFRNTVIPYLEKSFPRVNENILENINRFREVEQLYTQAIDSVKKKLLETRGDEVHIPVLKLANTTPLHSIVYEIVRDYGFTSGQVNDIIRLLESESGKYIQSPTHRIIRNRNWLIIAQVDTIAPNLVLMDSPGEFVFAAGKILLEEKEADINSVKTSADTALLDLDKIRYPLILRRWKQGDYFYPLGMKKKKKLARFFIDRKLSRTDKEKVFVVEMNRKIIWVVGHRIDERFRITEQTRRVLRIRTIPLP